MATREAKSVCTKDSLVLTRPLLFLLGFKVVQSPKDPISWLLTNVTLAHECHLLSLSFLICRMEAMQSLPH